MSKEEWLKERVFVDIHGRPIILRESPMTYMTRKESFLKQGYSEDEINRIYNIKSAKEGN